MKVFLSKYQLDFKDKTGGRKGHLLKCVEGDLVGYSDLHLWPELGDPHGDEIPEDLLEASISWASRDALARKEKKSFWTDLKVPQSHQTLLSAADVKEEAWAYKVKVNPESSRDLENLDQLMKKADANSRWRFDMNEHGTAQSVQRFWEELPGEVKKRVDWIEDPCPYDFNTWKALAEEMPIAIDWPWNKLKQEQHTLEELGVKAWVVKPIRLRWEDIVSEVSGFSGEVLVTSVLDHPLGQSVAAYGAGLLVNLLGIERVHAGLQTHSLYRESPFSQELSQTSEWRGAKGFGFGFDHLLKELKWRAM